MKKKFEEITIQKSLHDLKSLNKAVLECRKCYKRTDIRFSSDAGTLFSPFLIIRGQYAKPKNDNDEVFLSVINTLEQGGVMPHIVFAIRCGGMPDYREAYRNCSLFLGLESDISPYRYMIIIGRSAAFGIYNYFLEDRFSKLSGPSELLFRNNKSILYFPSSEDMEVEKETIGLAEKMVKKAIGNL